VIDPRLRNLRFAAVLAAFPLLGGFKCIKYDAPEVPPDAAPQPDSDGTPTPGVDGAVKPPFVPAVACADDGVAKLTVENYAYNIVCGCKEDSGLKCTVPAGTTVVWTFADSEQHNITSIANAFGMSPNLLAGQFTYTFTTAGTYDYGCSIHGADMAGYSIVAE